MKIGMGGLHIESCTFSPLLSRETDFRVLSGQDLLDNYPFLAAAQVTMVPLLFARALPGGPIETGFYQRFKAEFLRLLAESGPLDGLFLLLHGAVYVEGLEDAEGDFLSAIRAVVGPDCLIAASYDLHGNLSERCMSALDLLSAYRTAPHIDWYQTYERVFAFLIRSLERKLHPHMDWIQVPVLFSGEKSSTEWQPAASLYRQIPDVLNGDEVMDASILMGYIWADEPRSSASVVAFGLNREKVRLAVRRLAQELWAVREQFQFGVTAADMDHCIQSALESPVHPVIISDSGDNPTAGGAGDIPAMLERLLALDARGTLVAGIVDSAAVESCQAAGEGAVVKLSLGGKLDPIHAAPLAVTALVRSLHNPPWTLNSIRDPSILNPTAVVAVDGVTVVLTARRTVFHRLSDFTNLGIDPHTYPIIVVKIGYLEPELRELAALSLLALSPGAVNQDILSIPYHRIQRPLYPFDRDFTWEPG
jgi:microcystin degradation protein MlrC